MLQSHGFLNERQYAARGRFFLYQSSNAAAIGADERIRVEVGGQPLGDFYVGDSISLPAEASDWRVTPYATGLSGMVVIGDGDVRTNRVAGSIKVIDNGVEITQAGRQYLGAGGTAADPAKCSMIGIRADTVALAVRSIVVTSDLSGAVTVVSATGTPTDTPVNKGTLASKILGNPNEARATRWGGLSAGTNPTTVELPGRVGMSIWSVKAGEVREVTLKTPLIIPAGWGLFIVSPAINCAVTMNAEIEVIG